MDPLTFAGFQGALLLSHVFNKVASMDTTYGASQGDTDRVPWEAVILFYNSIEAATHYLNYIHAFFSTYLRDSESLYRLTIKHDPSVYLQLKDIYKGPREAKYLTELYRYIEAMQENDAWSDLLFQISYGPSTSVPCCYFAFALGCLWESISFSIHHMLPFDNIALVDLRVHDRIDLQRHQEMQQQQPNPRQPNTPRHKTLLFGQERPYHPILQACPLLFLQEGDTDTARISTLLNITSKVVAQFSNHLHVHRRIGSGVFRLNNVRKRLHESRKLCASYAFKRKMEVKFGMCISTASNTARSSARGSTRALARNSSKNRWISSALQTDTYKTNLTYISDLEFFITDDSCEAAPASASASDT